MLCFQCNSNQADYSFVVNYMGHLCEVHICKECLEKMRQFMSALHQQSEDTVADYSKTIFGLPVSGRELGGDPFPRIIDEKANTRRKLLEMKASMHRAIENEDYELAAKLRDDIANIEKEVCIQ